VLDDVSLEVPEHGSLGSRRNGGRQDHASPHHSRFTRIHKGNIFFRGRDVTRTPPHQRARNGLGWVAQEREVFPSLT